MVSILESLEFLQSIFQINNLYFLFFLHLHVAAGLYYIAELVEEYTVIAKKVISTLVLVVTATYVLFLFFDDLPWSMVICGLVAQAMHAIILTDFPYVKLMSFQFIGAIILLVLNHYFAFNYFQQNYFSFSEVIPFEFIEKYFL